MKTFFSVLLVLITVWSVLHPESASCDDFNESSSISSAQSGDSDISITAGNGQHSCDFDPHHSVCHSCHLGHCAFTLERETAMSSYSMVAIKFPNLDSGNLLAGFGLSLFRPPIV